MGRESQEILVKTRPTLLTNSFCVSTFEQQQDKSLFNEICRLNANQIDKKDHQIKVNNNIFYSSPTRLSNSSQLISYNNFQPLLFNRSSNIELNSVRFNQLDLILDQSALECPNKSSSVHNNTSKNWVLRKSSGIVS